MRRGYESTRRRFGGERGPSACARFRPSRLARAARPRAARGRRQAAVGTSRRRAARRRPKNLSLQLRHGWQRERAAGAIAVAVHEPTRSQYLLNNTREQTQA